MTRTASKSYTFAQVGALALQLLPNAVQMLRATLELPWMPSSSRRSPSMSDDAVEFALPLFHACFAILPHQVRVFLRVEGRKARSSISHLSDHMPRRWARGA